MFFISEIKNIWQIYKIYNLINNIKNLSEITDEYCHDIKQRIFAGGCIFIKFGQWMVSKMRTEANINPKIAKFCDYFEDIFEQCPKHRFSYSRKKFNEEFGYDINQFININTLRIIASGSVGQVYYAELLNPIWIYNEIVYYDIKDLIREHFNYLYTKEELLLINNTETEEAKLLIEKIEIDENVKKVVKVAIKVKHPHVNSDIKDKIKLFNFLSWIQSKPCLKRRFGLHLDFQEFINNVLQQIDFNNEKINCDKFRINFTGERLVYYPKVLYSTSDIVISEFIDCEEYDNIPDYKQLLTCYNFTCIVSKMMLIDNFAHMDLHHKNWKVRKINDKDYQIVIFDFGIIYEGNDIELNRKIWYAFETKNNELFNEILDKIVVGDLNDDLRSEIMCILDYYSKQTLDLSYIFATLNNLLSIHNCKLSGFTLNLILNLTLIESVLKKHNIMNNVKPVTNHHQTIREKQLDILAYCNSKKCYKDYADYINEKIKLNNKNINYNKKEIFNGVNGLELDLPE
jgi:predicted unusual protein kinase regulating ubiquinone biosynthesis (AarF/ABC1/UbiB family)